MMSTRWTEICNKFSTDLMVLTIECLDTEIDDTEEKAKSIKETFLADSSVTNAESLLKDHTEILHKLRKEITLRKQRKFQRDSHDYENNCVYEWREERNKQRQQRRGLPPFPRDQQYHVTRPEDTRKWPARRGGYSVPDEERDQRRLIARQSDRPRSLQEEEERGFQTSSSEDDYGTTSARFLGVTQASNRGKRDYTKPMPREPYPRRDRNQRRN
ncbi:uncharacterized protein LOC108702636 isoform X3 [Xenopus laevis]|uniref:Uncharacterized protein LOC108702636 isoform X3 n=1 Tax=Xenopus laevis TaxID=8355 RepID=A0A8J1M085_XENLA|nr:uncharacterized protein LOC108702636 isoform X3 [Xenopus laevis]